MVVLFRSNISNEIISSHEAISILYKVDFTLVPTKKWTPIKSSNLSRWPSKFAFLLVFMVHRSMLSWYGKMCFWPTFLNLCDIDGQMQNNGSNRKWTQLKEPVFFFNIIKFVCHPFDDGTKKKKAYLPGSMLVVCCLVRVTSVLSRKPCTRIKVKAFNRLPGYKL